MRMTTVTAVDLCSALKGVDVNVAVRRTIITF